LARKWKGLYVSSITNSANPLVDATGLKGTYDLSLYWVPDSILPDAGGPTILGALQKPARLNLESEEGYDSCRSRRSRREGSNPKN
jgi:uncharacterized protein (TIGR03435 family)